MSGKFASLHFVSRTVLIVCSETDNQIKISTINIKTHNLGAVTFEKNNTAYTEYDYFGGNLVILNKREHLIADVYTWNAPTSTLLKISG